MATDPNASIEVSLIIPQDVSDRALSIARAVDRLPAGYVYHLEIQKPDLPAMPWMVEIVREDRIQSLRLTYHPE
jgi:hypothetical protein